MAISEKMPWGTIIEMMPGKRSSFRNAKDFRGIYLGKVRGTKSIKVIRWNCATVQKWHASFWRICV
jgi:hypothetical protein